MIWWDGSGCSLSDKQSKPTSSGAKISYCTSLSQWRNGRGTRVALRLCLCPFVLHTAPSEVQSATEFLFLLILKNGVVVSVVHAWRTPPFCPRLGLEHPLSISGFKQPPKKHTGYFEVLLIILEAVGFNTLISNFCVAPPPSPTYLHLDMPPLS